MEELLKIQAELSVPKNQRNNFGNYSYRSFEDICEGIKPLLEKYKCTLKLFDRLVLIGDRYYVKAIAILRNSDGKIERGYGYAREEESKKGMDASQITGACSSYARKYALNGLFLLDDVKDADSMDNTEQKKKSQYRLGTAEKEDVGTKKCPECGGEMEERKGVSKSTGKPYHLWQCLKDKNHKEWIN